MKYSVQIVSAKKATLIEDGSEFLDVEFQIIDGEGNVEAVRRLGFPLDTPAEEIQEAIAKHLANHINEKQVAQDRAEVEALNKKADETIEELTKGIEPKKTKKGTKK